MYVHNLTSLAVIESLERLYFHYYFYGERSHSCEVCRDLEQLMQIVRANSLPYPVRKSVYKKLEQVAEDFDEGVLKRREGGRVVAGIIGSLAPLRLEAVGARRPGGEGASR